MPSIKLFLPASSLIYLPHYPFCVTPVNTRCDIYAFLVCILYRSYQPGITLPRFLLSIYLLRSCPLLLVPYANLSFSGRLQRETLPGRRIEHVLIVFSSLHKSHAPTFGLKTSHLSRHECLADVPKPAPQSFGEMCYILAFLFSFCHWRCLWMGVEVVFSSS